jgi:hypothetical protein
MYETALLVLVIVLIWVKRCCIKKFLSVVYKDASCGCKQCSRCLGKQTCNICPKNDATECKCSTCDKHKDDVKRALTDADNIRHTEGFDGTVKTVVTDVKKPIVETKRPVGKGNAKVVVKVPPAPKCDCPKCPTYDTTGTYYPIYQPTAYGSRY